ncbi:MAG: TetR/AcrR family transcriptional regulator [Pseudomonadota bacterium]
MAKQTALTRDRIISTAITLLDRGGQKNFSMRKLAAEFGVDPMAIYYHIPSRAALMSHVVDAVVSQCELPLPEASWQQTCKSVCHGFRQLAHRHPGVIQVFDKFEDWVPAEHRINEALHQALQDGGFDNQLTVRAARLLLAYTENFCAWELNDWITPYTVEMRSELVDSLAQGDFPLTTRLVDDMVNIDPDAEFEFGLEVLIRGLEASGLPAS